MISLASGGTGPVGCYLPTGSEPGAAGSGSVTVADLLLDAGHEVLVPVVPAEPEPLDWARHTGPGGPVRGPLGVPEPTGDRLGADAVRQVRLLLVPALAVDRRGRRLGRGGGYYDRTLPLLGTGTTTAALLHDDEFLDEVPAEPHDAPVGAVVLPRAGTVRLPVPASTRERT
ncbi:5-formyltetrahydrofolate cyclo-ligase [Pseudonocardia sp. HH130630-07]|nr:5-formyltetrahydrofolate cyclo-ligase [Pseudonocardia sp. HH130630-07]